LGDWRGKTLAKARAIIHEADPEIVEEWKWMGTPVWSHGGIVCTGETYKNVVKMTFAKGAALKDPTGLFNSSLDGNVRRAIDIHEGDKVDESALKDLIRAAVALNLIVKSKTKAPASQQQACRLALSQARLNQNIKNVEETMSQEYIEIRGARENNLKNVSLRIPKRKITIFTGVSGSGKSSIVFDTVATEATTPDEREFSACSSAPSCRATPSRTPMLLRT